MGPIYYFEFHYFNPVDQKSTTVIERTENMASKDVRLKFLAPAALKRNKKCYIKDPKERIWGVDKSNLRQRGGPNKSSYFHPNSSGQK